MNDSTQEQQPTQSEPQSFGDQIRQARETRGLSIDDLVGETRIHPQHLVDLEQGKTSGISATGYVTGYLRTLAKLLDLDAEDLIRSYKSSLTQANHQAIDPEHELLPLRRKSAALGWSTVVATIIIGIAALGAIGYYWWENMNDRPSNEEEERVMNSDPSHVDDSEYSNDDQQEEQNISLSTGEAAESAEAPMPDNETDIEDSLADVGTFDTNTDDPTRETNSDPTTVPTGSSWVEQMRQFSDVSNETQNEESAAIVTERTENTEEDELEPETEELEKQDQSEPELPPLVFEFSDVSYVEVTDADDKQLVSETKQAGTKLELEGNAPFTVKLGYAPGVTVIFEGEKIDLSGYTRRNIAEFKLPP